jgi:LysR family transcriptional regulator, low CO2-responsive transcriptional regulator
MDEHLLKLIYVIESSNMTSAAIQLGISQPALSIAIKSLESKYKSQLLVRSREGISMTPIGKKVYEFAKMQQLAFDAMSKEIHTINQDHESELKFGAIDTVGKHFIEEIYSRFSKLHSPLHLNLCIDNTNNLIQLTQKGSCDISIITLPTAELPGDIHIAHIGSEEMALVVKPEVAATVKNLKDISEIPLVIYNKNSNSYEIIRDKFERLHIKVKVSAYSTSPELMKTLVIQGGGMSFLPFSLVESEVRDGTLSVLNFPDLTLKRKLAVIYRKNTYLSKMQKDLIMLLQKTWP